MAAAKREGEPGRQTSPSKRIKLEAGSKEASNGHSVDRAAIEANLLKSLGLAADALDVKVDMVAVSKLPLSQGATTLAVDDIEYGSDHEESDLHSATVSGTRPKGDYDMDSTDDEEEREAGLRSPLLPASDPPRSARSLELRIDDLDDPDPAPQVPPEQLARTQSIEVEGMRVFPCRHPRCESRFLRLSKLAVHQRRHQTPRAYGCNICQIAFSRGRDLKRHLLTHAQQFLTPGTFRCAACETNFQSLGVLQRHHLDPSSESACRELTGSTTDGQDAADGIIMTEYHRMVRDARKPLPPSLQAAQLEASERAPPPGRDLKGEYALLSAHVITALHGLVTALASANGGQLEEAKAVSAICEVLVKAELGGATAVALRAVLGDAKTVHMAALQAARVAKQKKDAAAAGKSPTPGAVKPSPSPAS